MKTQRFLLTFLFIWLTTPLFSQQTDPAQVTLERLFATRDFASERFGPARFIDGGTGYTTLEKSAAVEGARDIVRYDTQSGAREVFISAQKLIPATGSDPLRIENYLWSPDKSKLMIFTNSQRVWRQNTRGDYWVLDLASGNLHQLGGDAQPSTLMFATFSPDGQKVGYVMKNNVYVEDLGNHRITQLTFDGSETIINGTFDWVYEEEFSLRNGFRWSPDSRWIAYWQLDASGVGEFLMINNTDSVYSFTVPVQYPKVGTTNSACRVGVVSVAGSATRWMSIAGDPRNNYIARMEWSGNSNEIVLQHLNRLQNTNQVMLGDIHTGEVRTIVTDRDEAWLDVVDDWLWLEGDKAFTWVSERDGWRHIYRISRDGKQQKLLTPGEYDVASIETIDESSGWIYFIASPDNPTQRYLYRVRLKGGKAERITPANQPGTHSYQMSPDTKWAIHTYSNFDTPPVISLVSLPDHKIVRPLAENAELRETVNKLARQPVEFFRVDIGDGVELDGWCIKPPDFDPNKKYPLFYYVYGEPAGQTVLDRWGGRNYLWHTMLAQQGYVVMSIDNRGTPAPRGRAWRKSIYGQIGILASKDQAAATKQILATRPYLDADRVGIWGWSGGGSMTLNMLFRYPEMYHTGMSVAPVSNQRFYDTIYQERYMGLPDSNVDGFRDGSPVTYAHQLKGNLLLVHGTGDDNVHYQSAEYLVNELIRHNKPFSMMSYPNRSHGIFEGQNTSRHLFELLTRYLHENLPAGPKAELMQ